MRSIVGRSRSRARATGPGPGSTAADDKADFGVVGVLGVVRYTIPVPVRGRSSRGALPEPDGTALADALRPIVIGAPLAVRALVVVAEAAAVGLADSRQKEGCPSKNDRTPSPSPRPAGGRRAAAAAAPASGLRGHERRRAGRGPRRGASPS